MILAIAALTLAAWLGLVLGWHGFWRLREFLPPAGTRETWPAVGVVVPARDEAETIARVLDALLAQDYPGALHIILVDDQSSDGTGAIARAIVDPRLTVIGGAAKPQGWSGKLWAVDQGVRALPGVAFVFLTDADTVHGPATLRRLVDHALRHDRALVSLMVRLACAGFWEKLLVPAFVFFFRMLYPFAAVNDDRSRIAGAAGACVLVRHDVLMAIGGIAAIKGALIDDCSLAAAIKRAGHGLWLGLADDSHSLRRYPALAPFADMVARTAYTQLRHSPLALLGAILGLALLYIAPPALALFAPWPEAALGLAAWIVMLIAYVPMVAHYGMSGTWALALPVVAVLYGGMTILSALRHRRGQGGLWKGRSYPASPA